MTDREHPPPDPFTTARHDLTWYFDGSADAELGARAQTYDPSGSGGAGTPDAALKRQEYAALRYAHVAGRLRAMLREHAWETRVLRAAFTPTPRAWPIPPAAAWYELGPVAAVLVDPDDVFDGARRVAAIADTLQ